MTRKVKVTESYCLACECLLLTERERFEPICADCFKKTRRKDPLMQAAIRQTLVAVVPVVCPHADERGHRCRTSFNVLVLDKKLEPVQITGPYSLRAAEKLAGKLRNGTDRRKP